MASLFDQYVDETFGDLLQISNDNDGIDGTLRAVSDGKGTSCPLQLSSAYVNVTAFKYNGSIVSLGGAFTAASTVSFGGAVAAVGAISLAGPVTTVGAYSLTLTSTNTTSITLPTTGTLATLAGTETLTNKTLTTPIFSTISNTGTLTLPTSTDVLVGRATTDTLTNKTLTSPSMTSPTMTTPTLGVATATSINKVSITAPATNAAITISEGKGFTCSNTLVLSGTDSSSIDFGTGGTVSYLTAASQSDQELGTSNTKAITPLVQQYHQSACKAWVRFIASSAAISLSYNVSSVTDHAAGDFTVNFTTSFNGGNYAFVGTSDNASGNVGVVMQKITSSSPAAASCRFEISNGSGTLQDHSAMCVAFFGDI